MSHSRLLLLALALAWFLFPCRISLGQVDPAQSERQTQLVKLGMIVTDHSNHWVDDVKQEDIQVLDDGVPQKIIHFARDDRPVIYSVAVDTSGSFRLLLDPTLQAVKLLIESNSYDDATMLVKFVTSDNIQTVQEFTSDKSKLRDSLKLFRTEEGQTAVIDAVYRISKATAAYEPAKTGVRRALVLISDGEDRNSFYKQDALFKLLRQQDVQVFVIGIVAQLDKEGGFIRPSPRQNAENFLNRLAEETGGRAFFPKSGSELLAVTTEVIHDLHSQYIIGFERRGSAGEKGYRKLRIKSAPGSERKRLKIIARPGYWIKGYPPAPAANEKNP